MPKISDLVPLPGVSELHDIAQDFVKRLKVWMFLGLGPGFSTKVRTMDPRQDADIERDERAALASQLESLIKCASNIDNLSELNECAK